VSAPSFELFKIRGKVMGTVPIQSDMTESLPLKDRLEAMTKKELVAKADEMGFQIDARLKPETIIKNLLKVDADRKVQASELNKKSFAATVSKDDPEITVKFFNMIFPNTALEFSYPGPRGMYGKEYTKGGKKFGNPKGHKKCPQYRLFPGEVVKLAYSVYEHLTSLTFVTHKTIWDEVTGNIKGNIPIVKPKYILQPILTKEQLIKLNQ
jgi:hypothetical protein